MPPKPESGNYGMFYPSELPAFQYFSGFYATFSDLNGLILERSSFLIKETFIINTDPDAKEKETGKP